MKLNILCIGDIVGRPGREVLEKVLPGLKSAHGIDCVIANAENSAAGSGITPKLYKSVRACGVDIITLGDHAYKRREIVPILEENRDIIRPANLSRSAPGCSEVIFNTAKGASVGVISLIGRVFMQPANCPFEHCDNILGRLRKQADIIVAEVHGEATSEKAALAHYLDGKVSFVFGTHTHVQTADERILPKGTGFITDIGMTGPFHSIIGRDIENVIKSMRTQVNFPFDVASEDLRLSGVIAVIDTASGKTESVTRVIEKS
ncbi:metallophosphoesterase, MG_246/ family [Sedimentisphaera cyanobacteriorum]|uniref:Metallophosphoesterase, MG_246/ family n=1 Tax=Sedimentisphaera cyanobacteriorum TaxID=1940790 RepID=A0A1Q2HSG3_9BACT|nr:TIGR00282 family metallophosphoesterase [Sedimentisphaera cyanobacteriorum]AQQ10382.1 metallophosphoesterase, MG_246/ family [Sedimentisphaera cyanobacteriorum]